MAQLTDIMDELGTATASELTSASKLLLKVGNEMKSLPGDAVAKAEDANLSCFVSIPSVNAPTIVYKDNEVRITFPDTSSTGGNDANCLWYYNGNGGQEKLDYSSQITEGVGYYARIVSGSALIWNRATQHFSVVQYYNSGYKGDFVLIAAVSGTALYGPIVNQANENTRKTANLVYALDTRVASIENSQNKKTYKLWNNNGFLWGAGGSTNTDGTAVGTATTGVNFYSDLIAVNKGDVVRSKCAISNEGLAIAFYSTNELNSYVRGTLGRDNSKLCDYIFICPADGYVSASTSKYACSDALNGYIEVINITNVSEYENGNESVSSEFLNQENLTKQGIVLDIGASGDIDDAKCESPCIWYEPSLQKLVMIYTAYQNSGDTVVASIGWATSTDGITWEKQGKFFGSSGVSGDPDYGGTTGPVMVRYDGKYHLFYIGLTAVGYEQGTKSLCLAVGDSILDFVNNTATRKGTQISAVGGDWCGNQIWHPTFIKKNSLWYLFINASGAESAHKERIGFAIADSLEGPWNLNTRKLLDYIDEDTISGRQIAIDPSVISVDGYYVMMYGTRLLSGGDHVEDHWAFCTKEDFPYGWQFGGVGAKPSESYDAFMAHKPFLLKYNGRIYHYYTAVKYGTDEHRCIALIK